MTAKEREQAEVGRTDHAMRQHNAIFVFGSNTAGVHGAGAALYALKNYGAIPGIGFGPQGRAFGIPTRDYNNGTIVTLDLWIIEEFVGQFKLWATLHPEQTFIVTRIGCGYAGYTDSQIAPMFRDAPWNCELPDDWR